jgi:hypothetical protein
MAVQGRATVADGSTGGICSLCCSLGRADDVRQDERGRGEVGSGKIGQQLQTAAQELSGSSAALARE